MHQSNHQDLIWNIGKNRYIESTVGFIKRFESALCLFSSSLHQLYSNYEIIQANQESGRMIALPNPYAFHDTYSNILNDAIIPTGVHLAPSEIIGSSNKKLLMLFRSKKSGKIQTTDLETGFKALEKSFGKDNFLPVMVNNDLRFTDKNIPTMHLHRIDLEKLQHISSFERSDIKIAIKDKMAKFIA